MHYGSHLGIKVRWQCFSSSETLHKKSFPVRILMLYACRVQHKNNSSDYHQPSHNTGIQLQHCEQVWHTAHFLEVQGVCRSKRTIPPGALQGYRGYTRSLYCCRCQSLHTAGEPWTLHGIKHSSLSTLETPVLKIYFQPHHVFIIRWGLLSCHGAVEVTSMSMWS